MADTLNKLDKLNHAEANKLVSASIRTLIDIEGGYSDDRDDSGGKTKYGLTAELLSNYGITPEDLAKLNKHAAIAIYEEEYRNSLKLDMIAKIFGGDVVKESLIYTLLQLSVLHGPHHTVVALQRAINVLNKDERFYKRIEVDGILGSATARACRCCNVYAKASGDDVARIVRVIIGNRLIELAEKRNKDKKFIKGWINRRVFNMR